VLWQCGRMSESPAGRGQLRTYLGIAPGVGKTYAMLRDGRARRRPGVDTVVAYRERHGRAATAAQQADLEVLATRTVTYRGVSFAELDVAAVLDRHPELALVDELAHANLPGEHHAKRWQDVEDLLASGIDVYTTLNVANVESLGALVARITGVRPAEPVPDAFVRAGEVELVDLAPAALRRRLAQGLVVPEERVDAALSSYFRFANLAALRELAQLWLDAAVPDPVEAFTAARGVTEPVQASVIVVGVQGSPADEWLIRYAARLAGLSDARLQAVHVRDVDNLGRPPAAGGPAGGGPPASRCDARDLGRGQGGRHRFGTGPGGAPGRRLPAGHRGVPPVALVASADRVHRGSGPPRGRRPAGSGRERRPAGPDQRRVAPLKGRRQASPPVLKPRAGPVSSRPVLRHRAADPRGRSPSSIPALSTTSAASTISDTMPTQ
jgi:Osmosensitive K+ channel His kinase sensor domain